MSSSQLKVVRQLYLNISGYGWTITETTDGILTATCTPRKGTTLTHRGSSLDEIKRLAQASIDEYEADSIDDEDTLVDIT